MKILFLDIDGVLNSVEDRRYNREMGIETPVDFVVPIRVKYLHDIIDATGCKIVISSTWRLTHSLEEIGKILQTNEIIGKTEDKHADRGRQILNWLNDHKDLNVERFIIVDDAQYDIIKYKKLKPFFVKTYTHCGLTIIERDEIIKRMNS